MSGRYIDYVDFTSTTKKPLDTKQVIEDMKTRVLAGMGMPAGSFSFALASMRQGKRVQRKCEQGREYGISELGTKFETFFCSKPYDRTRVFSTEQLLACDWEVVLDKGGNHED